MACMIKWLILFGLRFSGIPARKGILDILGQRGEDCSPNVVCLACDDEPVSCHLVDSMA